MNQQSKKWPTPKKDEFEAYLRSRILRAPLVRNAESTSTDSRRLSASTRLPSLGVNLKKGANCKNRQRHWGTKHSIFTLSKRVQIIENQEAMESFAFPDRINPIRTEITQTYSKLYFFSLESFEDPLYVWDVFSNGKARINKSKTCCYSNLVG